MTVKTVLIKKIEVDDTVLPRRNEEDVLVKEYAELRRLGIELPPIVIFRDNDGVHWLADGVKRLAAECAIEGTRITADVRKGDQSKARWFACGANRTHGQRLTAKDRKRAVQNCLNDPSLSGKSDPAIAEQIGCSTSTVRLYRKQLIGEGKAEDQETRTGTDGRAKRKPGKATSGSKKGTKGTQSVGRRGRPSRVSQAVKEAKVLKDELGQECPEFLRQVIADTQDMKRLLTDHAAIYQRWEAFGKLKSGAGQNLPVRSIVDAGKEERTMAQDAMFYCRCPECWEMKQRPQQCICGGKGKGKKKFIDAKGNKTDKAPGWLSREEYHEHLSRQRGA